MDGTNLQQNRLPGSGYSARSLQNLIAQTRTAVSSFPIYSLLFDEQKYWMNLTHQRYNRQSFLNSFSTNNIASYKFPLPLQVIDTNSVRWEAEALNTAVGMAQDSAKNARGDAYDIPEIFGKILPSVGAILQSHTGAAGSAVGSFMGLAPNEFLTMLFKGPTYKKFNLRFLFSPNSSSDASTLRNIIVDFKNAQAPALTRSKAFFEYPDVFNISFGGTDKLYEFKPSVLEHFSVDYAPPGVIAFHPDDNQCESVLLDMYFTEIQFWLKGDFK